MAEKDLTNEVLALPEEEQLKLLDAIVSNIDDEFELHPDWPAELLRRRQAVESGELELIPGDEFEEELKQRLGE